MAFKLRDAAGMRINGKEVHEAMLNNQLVWYNDKYCVEYTITPRESEMDTIDEMYNSSYAYYLPRIYTDNTNFSFNYEKILIFKKNGEVTTDTGIYASEVSKIKLWYPSGTHHICFYGPNSLTGHQVKRVSKIDTSNFKSLAHLFTYCNTMSYFSCEMDTPNVTDMSYMFSNCGRLNSVGLNCSDYSKVVGTSGMFLNCSRLTSISFGDSDIDMSSLTNAASMFDTCRDLISIDFSKWKNVTKIQYLQKMFYNCERLTTVKGMSEWCLDGLMNIQEMFYGCGKLEKLSIPNLIGRLGEQEDHFNMYDMFAYCSSLKELDLSNWNLNNGDTSIECIQMFDYCNSLQKLNMSNWDTRRIYYRETNMFRGVPSTVDFCYDGTNYVNWNLTEANVYFSGKFPWNQ